jgi:hypothetical protein
VSLHNTFPLDFCLTWRFRWTVEEQTTVGGVTPGEGMTSHAGSSPGQRHLGLNHS